MKLKACLLGKKMGFFIMQSLYSSLTLSRSKQLLAAALLWTLVGCGLLIRGGIFLISGAHYFLLIMVLVLGIIKSFFVFRSAARNNISRMQKRGSEVFICAVFPLRTWILIAVMIILGFLIRLSPLSREVYGLVISGIGLGMLIASGIFWKAWRREESRTKNG